VGADWSAAFAAIGVNTVTTRTNEATTAIHDRTDARRATLTTTTPLEAASSQTDSLARTNLKFER
jgi:hypothetical protein